MVRWRGSTLFAQQKLTKIFASDRSGPSDVLYAGGVTQVSVFGPHAKTFTQCQIAYLARCKIRPSCGAGRSIIVVDFFALM